MSAEESSPLEGTAGSGPERTLRVRIAIIAGVLVFIMAAYAYVGTRGDTTPVIEHESAVAQQAIDALVCCTAVQEQAGERYLMLVSRELERQYRPVAFRVMAIDQQGVPTEVNAIGSPVDSLLPVSFAIVGETAYLPLYDGEQGGVWAVDLSDPEWPADSGFTVTSTGTTRQLAAAGDMLAISHTEEIVLADISDPLSPETVARIEQPASGAVQLRIVDETLYVNDIEYDEIRRYRVSDPAQPEEIEPIPNPDGTGELPIEFGAADAADRLDQTAFPGKYLDIEIADGYGYVAASDQGVRVLDLDAAEARAPVAELALPDRAIRVSVDGDRLYVLGGSEGDVERLTYAIRVVDISDPQEPVLIQSIEDILAEPGLQSFESDDGYVYAGLGDSLLVFEP